MKKIIKKIYDEYHDLDVSESDAIRYFLHDLYENYEWDPITEFQDEQISKMKLEDLKLLNEMVMFRYAELGYQFHEKTGEDFAWALSHSPSMIESYLDGEQLAPYEWLARRELKK